jgi:flagellar hook protein FlgE
MGLSQALYSGISGLSNHQRRMDNVGNNLANVNTVGFKKGVHTFQSLFAQTIRGGTAPEGERGAINPIRIGLGTNTSAINKQFTQGSLQVTGNQRDMAIEGNGFFILNTGIEGTWGRAYTRDGSFYLGTDGKLLAGDGMRVMGVTAEDGEIPEAAAAEDVVIPIGTTGAAQQTTFMRMTGNLNSDVEVAAPNIVQTGAAAPAAATDSTWVTGTPGGAEINVGHVETSAGLLDVGAYGSFIGPFPGSIDIDGDAVADGTVADTDASGTYSAGDEVNLFGTAVVDGVLADYDSDGNVEGVDLDGDGVSDTIDLPWPAGDGDVDNVARPAQMGTDLVNLRYLRGNTLVAPFSNVQEGDEITVNWRKGGRRMSAVFTYGNNYPGPTPPFADITGDGTTLQDFMTFLCGGVNDDGTTPRLTGGAMGTVHTREYDSTALPDPDPYDVVSEHAGAFLRQFIPAQEGSVDYDNDGVNDFTSRVSIASNLGEENAVTDLEFSFDNVTYSDMFASDIDTELGAVTGGSTTTNAVLYDSLGNAKEVTMQMTLVNRDTNFSTWRWVADSTDDTDATWLFKDEEGDRIFNKLSPTPTGYEDDRRFTNVNVGTGLVRFDSDGKFVLGSELSSTNGISIDLVQQGVDSVLNIGITPGDETQDLDFSSLTQVAAASDFNLKEQDGSPPGTLDTFTVTSDGVINGVFSNGVLEVLGRLVLALVPNPQGLIQAGENLFIEGPASGEPTEGFPSVGGRGQVRAGSLELSNVDLSEEFTNLIVTERGFQANARVISTSDEMLVELVNLKR